MPSSVPAKLIAKAIALKQVTAAGQNRAAGCSGSRWTGEWDETIQFPLPSPKALYTNQLNLATRYPWFPPGLKDCCQATHLEYTEPSVDLHPPIW
jgi:hypothetical protein